MGIDPKNRDKLCALLEIARQYGMSEAGVHGERRAANKQGYADQVAEEMRQFAEVGTVLTSHTDGKVFRSANALN